MVDHFEGRGVAGYIRVSSDKTNFERSVAAQKDEIQKFAQEHGSGNITWYIDKGTGIALPALQSLRADAGSSERGFDCLLVHSFSRLSRNAAESCAIMSEFRDLGITLISVFEPDGSLPMDRFIKSMIQMVNDFYRESQSRDIRRGIAAARLRRQGD